MSDKDDAGVVQSVDDVSDDALDDAAFELSEIASHIGWTDERRELEYRAIASHLRDVRDGVRETGKELKVSLGRWRLRVQVTKEGVTQIAE